MIMQMDTTALGWEMPVWVFFGFFLVLVAVVFAITFFGSPYARGFLQKITLLHALGMLILGGVIMGISHIITGSSTSAAIMLPIFLAAYFEEASKHLSTVGMLGKDFQFTRRDLAFFSLSVVLGFVFFENMAYFFTHEGGVTLIAYRSLFTLAAHLLSTLVCSWIWWRALSYPFFSLRYTLWFLFGFFLATAIHAVYNISLADGNLIAVVGFLIAAYGVFVMMIQERLIQTDTIS